MLLRNALWTIERNLQGNLTLSRIAESCGVSRFHLAHAFASATGMPIMQYVRGRRLSVAAQALLASDDGILSAALDAGYGSHEAFSRAFKNQFGVTPEGFRRDPLSTVMVPPMALPETDTMNLEEPRMTEAPAMLAVGLSERHAIGSPQGIPAQWARFMRDYAGAVPHRLPGIPVALNRMTEDEGVLDYTCAVLVSRADEVPDGLVSVRIPAQRYAVFTHRDHVSVLPRTYSAIWNEWFPSHPWRPVNTVGMERHLEGFDPGTGLGGVTLWIPVEPA
jgi:AraC family transcriptional regulator